MLGLVHVHLLTTEQISNIFTFPQADVEDQESLRAALQGAYAVFAVTNFWEKMSGEVEVQNGKNIADAAKVCLSSPTRWVISLAVFASSC